MLSATEEIKCTLQRIENLLTKKSKTTNETRVAALRRISDAVEYINKEQEGLKSLSSTSPLQMIKDILLGNRR